MIRIATLLALSLPLSDLCAQQSLEELERTFRNEVQQLFASSPSRDQRQAQLNDHIERLRTFVKTTAKGDDRWNGRLMLADLELVRGNRANAGEALKDIDRDAAPAMVLITAATMAQHLRLKDLRDVMVSTALQKDAPLEERLAMARMLMSVLQEIPRGEAIFTEALAKAKDDEQRAFILYHQADALREREDLPENTGFNALEKLSKELPKTYWGGVAKDRLRATRIKVGDDAIDFTAKTITGEDFTLSGSKGKPVVLAFYSAGDYDTPKLVALLEEQQQRNKSLVVVGVCLDRDANEIKKSTKQLGIDFSVIGDGKGAQSDPALRWFAEGPVVHVIDGNGKLAGIGLQAGTNGGRQEMTEIIASVVK